MNGYHLGEYYTCQEGIITLEKKCPEGLYYYDPCNEDTTDNDIQAKCGFGMFLKNYCKQGHFYNILRWVVFDILRK